jgi:hypothetical protein
MLGLVGIRITVGLLRAFSLLHLALVALVAFAMRVTIASMD